MIDPLGRKVAFLSQNWHRKVKKYQPFVLGVLAALGHKEAYVTDQSTVSDFDTNLPTLEKRLKIGKIKDTDYIWHLAHRLAKAPRGNIIRVEMSVYRTKDSKSKRLELKSLSNEVLGKFLDDFIRFVRARKMYCVGGMKLRHEVRN